MALSAVLFEPSSFVGLVLWDGKSGWTKAIADKARADDDEDHSPGMATTVTTMMRTSPIQQ